MLPRPRRRGPPAPDGASLVEFALVAPLLILIVIGGASLLLRLHVQSALEAAAVAAARVAARSGGDEDQVRLAVARQTRMLAPQDVRYCVRGTGYGEDVQATVRYVGALLTQLPFYNAPLPDAVAWSTGQSERQFRVGDCADLSPDDDRAPLAEAPPGRLGGPAVFPGVGTAWWEPGDPP